MKINLLFSIFLLAASLAAQDSLTVLQLLRQADDGAAFDSEKALEALSVSYKTGYAGGVKRTLKLLMDRELQQNNPLGALRYGVSLLRAVEKENRPSEMLDACLRIGRLYEEQRFYSKALAYYKMAEEQAAKGNFRNEVLRLQALRGDALMTNEASHSAERVW